MMRGTSLAGERPARLLTLSLGAAGALILLSALAACKKEEKVAASDIRPVRAVTVEPSEGGETVSLTGEIQARYQADIGFRVNGKIIERPVDVGTQVKKGDILARLVHVGAVEVPAVHVGAVEIAAVQSRSVV
jgi:multidrug efflux pump subunit AcrA (membrane-fusion protein)